MADDDKVYREIEHTADLAIEVEAPTRKDLFARAATALAQIMIETGGVKPVERREIEIVDDDDPDMMHDMLGAALNLCLTGGFVWRDADVEEREHAVAVWLRGEPYDIERHKLKTEIKAVTMHQLAVENKDGKWIARIVFDI